MSDRVNTFSLYQNAISDIQRNQTSLADVQRQLSTGQKGANFTDLKGDLSRSLSIQTVLDSTNSYSTQNNVVITRLSTYDLSLKNLQTVVTQLKSALVIERSSSGDSNPLADQAKNLLAGVADALNVQADGRYIFSGSKTDTQPVTNILSSNLINDQPSDSYYQGDDFTMQIKASQQTTLPYGIKANDPAMQDLIAALHMAIKADDGTDNDKATAIDLVNRADLEIAGLRSQNGNVMKQLQTINSEHSDLTTFLQTSLSDLNGADVTTAAIEAARIQTLLQASFQVFGQVTKLNLMDFLR